jgi:uncharacterized lipoprotein YmbA
VNRRALLAAVPALLAACGSTPTTEVFTLTRAGSPPPPASGRPILVHVDRATVAGYFDRAQLVTRRADYRVSFHEFAVWGEPIADLITRAVVDDLAQRFGADQVMATPSPRPKPPTWRIELDITRFDVTEAGIATLDARWNLLSGRTDALAASRREIIEAPAQAPLTNAARVAALRETLAALAERIAAAIATAR